MQNVWFEDFEDFACDIADKFDSIRELDEYNDVAIIAKYEEVRQIIKELLCIGYDLHSIVMHDEMWENYDAEYVISLLNIDGEDEIWCEPMLRNSGYLTEEAPIIYVMDNCSSKVIPYCKGKVVFEVTVGEEDYDCDECCGCCECDNDDTEFTEDTHGFTVSNSDENGYYSYSFYSTDKNLVAEMAKRFK